MPRYFFHLLDDLDVPDEEGTELPDLEAARAHADSQARLMFAAAATEQGRVVLSHRIDVQNEAGAVLASVRFGDVVKVEG